MMEWSYRLGRGSLYGSRLSKDAATTKLFTKFTKNMLIKQEIKKLVEKAAQKSGVKLGRFSITENKGKFYGDYSTNAALTATDDKTPRERILAMIANFPMNEIVGYVAAKEDPNQLFMNFELKKDFLINQIEEIIKLKNQFGQNDSGKGKNAQVEFISANPTGPLHLGNARGGPLGDVLSNVFEASSYKVEREFIVNDLGSQIEHFGKTLKYWQEKQRGKSPLFPKDGYKGKYMEDLAKKIKSSLDIKKLAKLGTGEMMDGMKKTNKLMGIEFDKYVYESDILREGRTDKVLKQLKDSKYVQVKEDALWFAGKGGEFLGDKECVLVRSDVEKSPTYFANDIAYHEFKFKRDYDLMIDVLGSNHYEHFLKIKEAMRALDLPEKKLKLVLYQYVRLKHAEKIEKMAKREGTYITADQVLNEVGKDVFRMMMLMSAPNTHLDFDFELAKERSKQNPVFYVQYAHARISGILRKLGKEAEIEIKEIKLESEHELNLSKELIKLPDLVYEISQNFEVHHLPHYAIDLAKKFHQFYKNCPVIKAKTKGEKISRIAQVKATQIVLKNTLNLMGIEAPEKM